MGKTIVILGSPRKNGNSTILADRAVEGIKASGGEYETFYLNGMNIEPCQACNFCRRNSGKCMINDDMQLLYPRLQGADSVLIASPIYWFNYSAQLKLFMDRCYASPGVLKGKRIGIILTYGDTDEHTSGAVNAIGSFKDAFEYTGSKIVGIVHGSADGPGEAASDTELNDKAYRLGTELAAK